MSEQNSGTSDLPGLSLDSNKGPENPPLPRDILEALDVLNGSVPMEGSGQLNDGGSPFKTSAQDRFQDALLKKEELDKSQSFAEEFEVFCLDLSQEEDRKKYQEVLSKVYALGSKYRITQTEIQNFVDKHSPRGFRAVITITLYKMMSAVPKDSRGVEFIKIGDGGKTERMSVPAP